MPLLVRDKHIRTFVISPRTQDKSLYLSNVMNVSRWAEQLGFTGVLLFTGNDTLIDPWVLAQRVMEHHNLSPLVAINPIYMHPFTAAKLTASLTHLYSRKVYLNMVTGTALSHHTALGDTLAHNDRYDRLAEYMSVLMSLLSGATPVSFSGTYYRVSGLQLPSRIGGLLAPEFLFAGHSESARAVCQRFGGTLMDMLVPTSLDTGDLARGVFCGLVTRPTEEEAWHVARLLFCEDDADGRELLNISMQNTDAVWKQRMQTMADSASLPADGFWLTPFRNFQSDCPYFIGGYERVARLLERLLSHGVDTLILNVPAWETEFEHVGRAFELARRWLDSQAVLQR